MSRHPNLKIVVTSEPVSLDIKRCYLPIEITDTCPTCGAAITKYLSSDYLSYPKVNQRTRVSMYHHIEREDGSDDEHSWDVGIVIRVTAEVAP